MFKLKSVLAVCSVLACSAAQATTVLSESFDSGLGAFSEGLPTVQAFSPNLYNGVGCCGGFNSYANGGAAIFGAGQTDGGLMSATFATVAGQLYTVSFDYGVFGSSAQKIAATVSPTGTVAPGSSVSYQVTRNGSFDLANIASAYSFNFTAYSSVSTLVFVDRSSTSFNTDGFIDNVSVTAVPEPQTLALMLAGLGAIAFVARRRQA